MTYKCLSLSLSRGSQSKKSASANLMSRCERRSSLTIRAGADIVESIGIIGAFCDSSRLGGAERADRSAVSLMTMTLRYEIVAMHLTATQ